MTMTNCTRVILGAVSLVSAAFAGESAREIKAFRGSTPTVDGLISAGEWDDATKFEGMKGWTPQFSTTKDPKDLSVKGWVKYNSRRLYFAFEVTDDVLYGLDTDRWLPEENAKAHELSADGWPWFGDGIEILINAANQWEGDEEARGDAHSWQMVCNVTKSRLGGIGVGGLVEGEPRVKESAWKRYQQWILNGAMQAAVRLKPEGTGHGYVVEWSVAFSPCLEVAPGRFFQPGREEVVMGLNIAVGDLDEKSAGRGNFGGFHHEDWFAGEKDRRTQVRQWGRLRLMPDTKKPKDENEKRPNGKGVK